MKVKMSLEIIRYCVQRYKSHENFDIESWVKIVANRSRHEIQYGEIGIKCYRVVIVGYGYDIVEKDIIEITIFWHDYDMIEELQHYKKGYDRRVAIFRYDCVCYNSLGNSWKR